MNIADLILLLIIFAAIILIAFYLILKKFVNPSQRDNQPLLLLQNQLNDLNKVIDGKMSESTKVLQQQFSESAKIIREITQELTKVGEGQKQVVDIAKQLDNLQDILKNPKQRGVVGEYYLKTVLENVLPPNSFQMQYEFKNGDIVDAVIFIKDKIIPIDSKFSLENYNRLISTKDEIERKRLEESLRQDLKKQD